MKKFEIGTYKIHTGEIAVDFTVEKVTAKTVTVTIFKGKKNEKTKTFKTVDNGKNQYCMAFDILFESDDEKIA